MIQSSGVSSGGMGSIEEPLLLYPLVDTLLTTHVLKTANNYRCVFISWSNTLPIVTTLLLKITTRILILVTLLLVLILIPLGAGVSDMVLRATFVILVPVSVIFRTIQRIYRLLVRVYFP